MSDAQNYPGQICWTDLTVENAEETKDFYAAVVGWEPCDHDMGAYCDFEMKTAHSDAPVSGICHSRGTNAGMPPQWLIYILVEDIDKAIARCKELNGEVIVGPKAMGSDRYCVIKDPAGAVAGLFQKS